MFFWKYAHDLFVCLCRVLAVASRIFSCSVQILGCRKWALVPWPGIEPGPLHWEHGATALMGTEVAVLLQPLILYHQQDDDAAKMAGSISVLL